MMQSLVLREVQLTSVAFGLLHCPCQRTHPLSDMHLAASASEQFTGGFDGKFELPTVHDCGTESALSSQPCGQALFCGAHMEQQEASHTVQASPMDTRITAKMMHAKGDWDIATARRNARLGLLSPGDLEQAQLESLSPRTLR